MMSKILDIDIVHNFTIEEEVKIDKKTQAETTKELNRSKYKNLLTQTKELTADKLILTNFYEELNIDFTGKTNLIYGLRWWFYEQVF